MGREMDYEVKSVNEPLHIDVEVPGSKSITNRALLMAAMAEGESVLEGVLSSDDSVYFLRALQDLGFDVAQEEDGKRVTIQGQQGRIPNSRAEIFVGSAGTAARFLTAFLAMNPGTYRVSATEQMKKRPMEELLVALRQLGAEIDCLEEEDTFPMVIRGIGEEVGSGAVSLNIDRSSQFLSALLMVAPLRFGELEITLTGTREARSYVEMTEQMMRQFGHPGVERLSGNVYRVSRSRYLGRRYQIEPDVSAACYFYAMAAVTGGSAVVRRMRRDSLQGDMGFLDILEEMGCELRWEPGEDGGERLRLVAPPVGSLKGFEASFSDFSDQTLTAAAIAPFANSPVTITGIGHIRGQESDRIHVIATQLQRMGIKCREGEDSLVIWPGKPKGIRVDTYDDHRVAMAFAVTGLRAGNMVIGDCQCCKKTFPEYFKVLDGILSGCE